MLKSFAVAAVLATALVQAQGLAGADSQGGADKTVTRKDTVKTTATIQAIDQATRTLTLRKDNGEEDTVTAGPDVTRFNQLKVGDKIKATYYESLVLELRKLGAPAASTPNAAAGGQPKGVPKGAAVEQHKVSVTVKAVITNPPTIVVVTPDNRTMNRKVLNKKDLEGVSPGDRIDITYTQALLVKIDPVK